MVVHLRLAEVSSGTKEIDIMSKKVITIRGREIAIESKNGFQTDLYLVRYNKLSDKRLDEMSEECKKLGQLG